MYTICAHVDPLLTSACMKTRVLGARGRTYPTQSMPICQFSRSIVGNKSCMTYGDDCWTLCTFVEWEQFACVAVVAICMLVIASGEYQSCRSNTGKDPQCFWLLLGLGEMGLGQPQWLRGGVGRHHHGALRTTFTPEGNSAGPNLSLLPSLPSDQ